jgi:hypothetical protein
MTVVFDREFGGRFETEAQAPRRRARNYALQICRRGWAPNVAGPTSRNWSFRYWFKGKERWHGLGSLQDVSLKDTGSRAVNENDTPGFHAMRVEGSPAAFVV